MRVFRDCGNTLNGGYDDPAGLSVGRSDGTYFMTNFPMHNPVIKNLSNLFSNPCLAVPPDVCVQEAIYTRTIDLPIDQVNSYYIIYQRCCRNNTIFNILNPGDAGATYYTEITPLAQMLHNSSPTFKTIPPIAVCGNFSLQFDHSATDIDGDSLAYYFVAPILGGGNNSFGNNCEQIIPNPDCLPPYDSVSYRAPFTSRNPMGGSPAVTVHSKTGLLTGTPNATGQFVVGVRVDEYRNGQLLSSTIRDFQFNVADCEKVVKASIEANNVNSKNLEFKFCGDEYDKIINKSSIASSIFDYTWQFNNNGVDSIFSTKDLALDSFKYGDYSGFMILNRGLQCTDTAFFKFTKFPGLNPDFTFTYDTCKAEGVRFSDLSSHEAGLSLNYEWMQSDTSFGVNKVVYKSFPGPGDYPVTLFISDANQCRDSLTTIVSYQPIPDKILALKDINGCVPAEILFPPLHDLLDTTYKVTWDFGDGSTGEGLTPTHLYDQIKEYDISVHVKDVIGCEYDGYFSRAVKIHDVPTAGFDYSPKEISNLKPALQIADNSEGGSRWTYEFGNGDVLYSQNPSYVFQDTGYFVVRQIVTNNSGCSDTSFIRLDVEPITTIFLPNAFLPSTDGENSTFRSVGNGFGIVMYEMQIFDRYGEKVFSTNKFEEGWDGLDKYGKRLPNGSYAVKVRMEGPRGFKKELFGTALLIR